MPAAGKLEKIAHVVHFLWRAGNADLSLHDAKTMAGAARDADHLK
jgi:hypothetical protein